MFQVALKKSLQTNPVNLESVEKFGTKSEDLSQFSSMEESDFCPVHLQPTCNT